MKRLLLILSLFGLCVAGRAGSMITATLTITNNPSDGNTLVVNGSTRTWRASAATPTTEVTIGAAIGASMTNLYNHVARTPFTTLTLTWVATNQITLRGIVDQTITVSSTGTWLSYTLATNTTTDSKVVRVPASSYPTASEATNVFSSAAIDLGTYSTNALAAGTTLVGNLVQTSTAQTVAGAKTFTSATTLTNTGNWIYGGTITNVKAGRLNIESTNDMIYFGGAWLMTIDMSSGVPAIYEENTLGPLWPLSAANYTVTDASILNGLVGDQRFGKKAGANTWTGTNIWSGAMEYTRANHSSLANGNNAAIDFGSAEFIKVIAGPTAAFTINGIANGRNGRRYTVYNATSQNMTVANDSGAEATAANRIYTGTGSDVSITGNGVVQFTYDSADSRWVVTGISDGVAVSVVNSTDGYLPYRVSSANFGDSPWYRISSTKMGFAGTSHFLFRPDSTTIGIGLDTLTLRSSAANTVAIGDYSLDALTSGNDNSAVGYEALSGITTGSDNTAIGKQAGKALTTQANNTVLGSESGKALTGGDGSVAVGAYAMGFGIGGGNYNTAVGMQALGDITSGGQNVAVGYDAMANTTTGTENVAVGSGALGADPHTGKYNVAVGRFAAGLVTSGATNTYVGAYSGQDASTGGGNVGVGYATGPASAAPTISNTIAIGFNVQSTNSNEIILGNTSNDKAYLPGVSTIQYGAVKIARGTGSPESSVTAPIGSLYSRTDGSAGTTLYVKQSGTGNTGWSALTPSGSLPGEIGVACSDETSALTTGTAKVTFRMPYAMTVSSVRATLSTAQTSGSIFTVDINEGGSTILSTKITVDNGEKTSTTAVTAPVLSDTALADDAEITIDIDQIGDGTAKGLKIWIIGTR